MGKDFTPVVINGFDLKKTYDKLFSGTWEIEEASDEKYFRRIPSFSEVRDIELGYGGTKESIIRLKEGGFAVVNKTIDLNQNTCKEIGGRWNGTCEVNK